MHATHGLHELFVPTHALKPHNAIGGILNIPASISLAKILFETFHHAVQMLYIPIYA